MREESYKVNITKEAARARALKGAATRRKNGNTVPHNKGKKGPPPHNKGQTAATSDAVRRNADAMRVTVRRQFASGERKPYAHTPETNAKIAVAKMGDKNPSRIYAGETKRRSREVMLFNVQKRNRPPTDIEEVIYQVLESRGIRYLRNHIMQWTTIPDAYIPRLQTVIYADGSYWHDRPERKVVDMAQDHLLRSLGYTVLRFTDKEILAKDFTTVLGNLLDEIEGHPIKQPRFIVRATSGMVRPPIGGNADTCTAL